MGFKAPLAYTSSFYFVCRKDGMERKYMMYEGEDVNTIDLLYETSTEQPNGVKVIVPVKYGDRYRFENKIKEQLAYFENVYFNVNGISNDFSIVRSEHFQFSPLSSDRYMHICLDNVYYPMDFNKLGIDTIYLPVALRFSLTDGIFPTPNRESLRYTQEAKTIILNKLEKAANYFIEKYNETVTETNDLKQVINHYTSSSRYLKMGNDNWDIHPLSNYATLKIASPKLTGVNLIPLERLVRVRDYILGEYDAKFYVNNRSMKEVKRYWAPTAINRLSDTVYIYHGDRIPGIKKDYLKSIQPNVGERLVVRKGKSFPLFGKLKHNSDYDNYYTILQLDKYPKSQWRAMIQEFQSIVNSYVSKFVNIDEMDVPQSFIDARKKSKPGGTTTAGVAGPRRIKLKGEMVCKQAKGLERWVDGKECKWVSTIYDMSKFHQNKFILVYGKQEDAEKMDKWFNATRGMNVELAILSERELKLIEKIDLHNLIPFSKFMEGKTKPFQRIATACLIDKFYDENRSVFANSDALSSISNDLYEKIEAMYKYRSKNYHASSDHVRDVIIEQAVENNAFDPSIYSDCQAVMNVCKKLTFLNTMLSNTPSYNTKNREVMIQAITDLFKYHKHRIDWKNYRIRLTAETVEELVNQD